MGQNYWMLVTSLDNFRITRERGFSVQGLKKQSKNRVQRMQPGDRMVYYLSGALRFAATATVASKTFEDHTPVWVADTEGEIHPYRVEISPEVVLE